MGEDTQILSSAQVVEQQILNTFHGQRKEKQVARSIYASTKGFFGLHQFYLGNKRRGWLMAVCGFTFFLVVPLLPLFCLLIWDYFTLESQVELANQQLLARIRDSI